MKREMALRTSNLLTQIEDAEAFFDEFKGFCENFQDDRYFLDEELVLDMEELIAEYIAKKEKELEDL